LLSVDIINRNAAMGMQVTPEVRTLAQYCTSDSLLRKSNATTPRTHIFMAKAIKVKVMLVAESRSLMMICIVIKKIIQIVSMCGMPLRLKV